MGQNLSLVISDKTVRQNVGPILPVT